MMTYVLNSPVLIAAGIQEVLFVVVAIISFIAWVIRQFQGNNQQLPPPVQRPGRRRGERGDDEIDSFLDQVNRNPRQRSARPETSRNQPNEARSKPPATVPQPTPAKQRQPARQLAEGLPSAPSSRQLPSAARQPEAPVAVRNPAANQSMSQPTKPQSTDRKGKEPQVLATSLPPQSQPQPSPSSLVPTNLGSFRASVPISASQTPAQQAGAASPQAASTASFLARTNNLRQALRNPQMISQAIVVQEILSRPKSLRK